MKIYFLHLFDLSFTGGSGIFLKKVCDEFVELEHEVHIFSAGARERSGYFNHCLPFDFTLTFGPEKRDGEITFDELSLPEINDITNIIYELVVKTIDSNDAPDLILVNHINILANVALRIKKRYDVPYLIISYGTDTNLIDQDNRYKQLFSEAVMNAENLYAISKYVAKQINETYLIEDVNVVPGAVDKGIFYPPPVKINRGNVITFVGRLVSEKGIWTLLKALEKPNQIIEVNIVGEGPLFIPIKEYISRTQLRPRVNLWGYLPQKAIRGLLIESKLLVVPSIWQEPLGLVVLESMACGTPVIGSAVGGIPEIISDGFNGFLVQPDDSQQLSELINRVLQDNRLLDNMTDNCINGTKIDSYKEISLILISGY
jgi:glycosyltransferase involved in cell wall biosynthesis